ncbi:hypothetical protein [Mediterraneibacter agrestimuris]|uniref:hypothetical protein n=1 Tax=Mediterraneibacter agrestimuris TaxID=2941333 RepID=UPI00203B6A33|nr:hypothetical protein [Mediterraneibacter agrestimuris]
MKELNKKELISLRKALMDVQQFIRKIKPQRMPYCYIQFDNMLNNIEIYLYCEDTDIYLISEILFRDWKNANHELLGISASEWNCMKSFGDKGEVYRFWELIAIIEAYFQETNETEEDFYQTYY